jgi:DNA polymerase V
METVDNINKTLGKNTVFYASEGVKRTWSIKCYRRSSRYTTRWNELVRVYCK